MVLKSKDGYSLDGEIIKGENITVELKEKALNILMK